MPTTSTIPQRPLASLFYGAGLAFNAGLLSLLVTLAVDKWHGHGCVFGYMLLWVFSIPWILIAGLLEGFTFPWFRDRPTWLGKTAVYVASLLTALALGMCGSGILAWMAN